MTFSVRTSTSVALACDALALPRAVAHGALMIGALLLATLATPAAAADPKGTWLTEDGRSRIAIGSCGGALCGSISWLREPNDPTTGKPKLDANNADAGKRNRPLLGVPIVLDMKPSGKPEQWAGSVYNAQDGKTYSGFITMQGASSLKLEGCALGGLVCKAQTWRRVN
jgi:uncharacterized protein (DUF2147 family)